MTYLISHQVFPGLGEHLCTCRMQMAPARYQQIYGDLLLPCREGPCSPLLLTSWLISKHG